MQRIENMPRPEIILVADTVAREKNIDKEDVFELGDHVAFVTHGDVYGVSWGEEELVSRAQEMGADVVFYGHTHCPAYHVYESEGVTVFNPGSIALPRQMTPSGPTFLIIDLADDGRLTPELYTL